MNTDTTNRGDQTTKAGDQMYAQSITELNERENTLSEIDEFEQRLRRINQRLEIDLGWLHHIKAEYPSHHLLMLIVQLGGAQEAIAKLLPEAPTRAIASHYRCRFWDGKGDVFQTFWASSIAELENKAYAMAFREGWQMLDYDLLEEDEEAA